MGVCPNPRFPFWASECLTAYAACCNEPRPFTGYGRCDYFLLRRRCCGPRRQNSEPIGCSCRRRR